MDRHLKERLIGAAVLVAAAIIFIPEMLSGPHEGGPSSESAAPSDANGVKTYTIDLANNSSANNSSKASANESAPAEATMQFAPAPTPAHNIPTTAELNEGSPAETPASNSTKNESVINATQSSPPTSSPVSAQSSKPDSVAEKSAQKVASSETSKPEKSESRREERPVANNSTPNAKPDVAAGGGWAVQVASFGQKPTADRIASELKVKGFSAFVTSTAVKDQTMYRVRVGPVADRPAAEALLKKVKAVHPNAAVVTQ